MYKYENYEKVGCSNCMNKQKIKSLIKRFKYLVYFVVGIGGIAMVTLAGSVLLSATQLTPAETLRYDICMGIGCSVIATAVVTVILLALLPENLEEDNELKEWGIDQIYEERGNIQITSNRFPKKNLDFIAFGLQHFRAANPDLDSIVNRIRKGLVIRILAPNPNSIYVIEQQKIENNANIQNDIMQLIEWVNKIDKRVKKRDKVDGSIEIKLYDNPPMEFYCKADDLIYVGPYMPGVMSSRMITFKFQAGSRGGKVYSDNFESIWSGENRVNIIDNYEDYFVMNQKKAVESALAYFCNIFQQSIKNEDSRRKNEKVIAVVAMFKNDLRRTFFSCNKPHGEKHICHRKDAGSVGELIQFNKRDGIERCCLFTDYTNNMAFVKSYTDRLVKVEKVENKAVKMRIESAILSVPFVKNGQMRGVLTFDFVSLPDRYEKALDLLRALPYGEVKSEELERILDELFTTAENCKEIVENLLGQSTVMDYKKLYEEGWKSDDK